MLPVSASEIARIRSDAASILDLSCQIQRKTRTPDGLGSATESWSTIATVAAAMNQPSGTHLQNYAYKIAAMDSWEVQLPYGTDVKEQDHLIINSQTLVVQVLLQPTSYQALTVVLAAQLRS